MAYRCDSGYRKREGRPSRFGSRTGHESCPFIRLLSVGSIEIDTSLGEISMTMVMTMSVEYLAVAETIPFRGLAQQLFFSTRQETCR